MSKTTKTPASNTDVIISKKYGPITIDFRYLGKNTVFVNGLAIELLCPIGYQEWKESSTCKDFQKTLLGRTLMDGGCYPEFWINCVVAIEYAKTSKYPISKYIEEWMDTICSDINYHE